MIGTADAKFEGGGDGVGGAGAEAATLVRADDGDRMAAGGDDVHAATARPTNAETVALKVRPISTVSSRVTDDGPGS